MTADRMNGCRRGKREEGEEPVRKNQIQLGVENEPAGAGRDS